MLSVSPVIVPDPPGNLRPRGDHNYDPEFWEMAYAEYRYLQNATVDELFERHEQIATNLRVFGTVERLDWPLTSVFSAWYWLRKEHQLRDELYRRQLDPRIQVAISSQDVLRPMRDPHAPYGAVLFRFSRRDWLERTLREGHLWLPAASTLLNADLGPARADDERKKVRILPGAHTRITNERGQNIELRGDLTEWVETDDYYMLSTAADYHPYLFDAFRGSEACLVIEDAVEFTSRFALALSRQHPDWDFGEMLVHYYDPRELAPSNEDIDPIKSKRFEYAFEMEWRFACIPPLPVATDHIELYIGSLEDIATIVPKGYRLVPRPRPT
jgi:hypothetical protein